MLDKLASFFFFWHTISHSLSACLMNLSWWVSMFVIWEGKLLTSRYFGDGGKYKDNLWNFFKKSWILYERIFLDLKHNFMNLLFLLLWNWSVPVMVCKLCWIFCFLSLLCDYFLIYFHVIVFLNTLILQFSYVLGSLMQAIFFSITAFYLLRLP